jgi:protein-L-isoaspartate(D-aspartate) O-methyltransferase
VENDIDSYRAQGMRKRLVEELDQELKRLNLFNQEILNAINNVPRHVFLDPIFLDRAYENIAFRIEAGQTISQPLTVAIQTTLLDLKKDDVVLEIGTGSGYQTAVLDQYDVKIFSIERQGELYDNARRLLRRLKVRAKTFFGDGYKGLPMHAPFDKIIVTCGAPYIPENLLAQMQIGGKMIIPVGEDSKQEMILIDRISETEYNKKMYGGFSFVPMLKNKNK